MNEKKLAEVNNTIRFLIRELSSLACDDFKLASARDYTNDNPHMGYSLGFSCISEQTINTVTVYLFVGGTYPANEQSLEQYHMSALRDIVTMNPEMLETVQNCSIDSIAGSGNEFGYLKTEIKQDHTNEAFYVISTFVFGIHLKIRASFRDKTFNDLENFLKTLNKMLVSIQAAA